MKPGASGDGSDLHAVTLYTAAGCSLCEEALEVLRQVRRDTPFGLETVDIATDATLEASYREWLPVVVIEGGPTFRLFVDADVVRSALRSCGALSGPRE